jgi:hypothetical protein
MDENLLLDGHSCATTGSLPTHFFVTDFVQESLRMAFHFFHQDSYRSLRHQILQSFRPVHPIRFFDFPSDAL